MTRPADYPAEPAHLFEHFYRISQIPRSSAEEAAVPEEPDPEERDAGEDAPR